MNISALLILIAVVLFAIAAFVAYPATGATLIAVGLAVFAAAHFPFGPVG
jgi:hypothetical protein